MKKANMIVVLALVVAAMAAAYWLGGRKAASVGRQTEAAPQKEAARKILYYRNAMGLPDTSPTPKKDAMGMDYIPVYEGDTGQGAVSVEKVQKLGVKTEQASMRVLDKTVRAAGRVEASERHIYSISPKFEGWIEKLYVNTTGELVKKGQPLFDVYSPELVSAQREYAIATQGEASMKDIDAKNSMKQLAQSSLLRLKNWGVAESQINPGRDVRRNLTFYAPVSGIVLEKKAVQGMRFMPGDALYQIADLSRVWVLADVAEQDIGSVKVGHVAQVNMAAYPDKHFEGKIVFVYPTLNAGTRTLQARIEIDNPNGLLKPSMFANVALAVGNGEKVLAVPISAVIDSGTRQIVLVQLAEGRFEPRTVRLGNRSDDYVEVLNGIAEGEQVVISANFLIDAESNLKAALGGLGHANGNIALQASPASAAEHAEHEQQGAAQQPKSAQAQGKLEAINTDGTVSISHEPIKSLGWEAMTMDYPLANSSLAQGIQPGTAIRFEIVERGKNEWVITRMQAKKPASHEEH